MVKNIADSGDTNRELGNINGESPQLGRLPLTNIKVIDLTRLLPGPYCTMYLADLGADVIRIEEPNFVLANPPPLYKNGVSAFNSILNRNKRSIAMNLKKPKALKIFYDMVKNADILVESFRPGVTKKLKIDYDTLLKINPSIIYCSLTGYGQNGPYSKLPGHDLNYLSYTGMIDLNHERVGFNERGTENRGASKSKSRPKPIVPSVQSGDISGALNAVIAILASLFRKIRDPEKEGEYIDISIFDCSFTLNPLMAAYHFTNESKLENPLHGEFPYYNIFETKDGKYISVGAIEPKFWGEFIRGLSLNTNEEMKVSIGLTENLIQKQFARKEEREKIFEIISKAIKTKSQKDWLEIFSNFDTPISPVNSFEEACKDPHIITRNLLIETPYREELKSIKNIRNPIKFKSVDLDIRRSAPKVGENTDEILSEMGFSSDEIKDFHRKRIIK
ncbi:MAG: CaiB/BaiF CoA transferase family protein [Promethearchaeota archaeon]